MRKRIVQVIALAILVSVSIGILAIGSYIPVSPFKDTETYVDIYLKLIGPRGIVGGTLQYIILLPENVISSLTGNVRLSMNETTVYTELNVSGDVVIMEDYNTSVDSYTRIKGSIEGDGSEINGVLSIDGNLSIQEGMSLEYDIPLTLHVSIGNVIVYQLFTDKAVINVGGSRVDVKLNYTDKIAYKENTSTVTIYVRAESSNINALMMVAAPLSVLLTGSMTTYPSFDPTTGNYYVELTNTTTMKLDTSKDVARMLEEYTPRIDHVEGRIDLETAMRISRDRLVNSIRGEGYFLVKGDLSKGIPLDPNAYTILRSIVCNVQLRSTEDKIVAEVALDSKYKSLNPYTVQSAISYVIPVILEYATSNSSVIVETDEGIQLYLDGKVFDKLAFTQANSTLASHVGLVVNGTVLESDTIDSVLVYRSLGGKDVVYVPILNTTRTVKVYGGDARKIEIATGENIAGKSFEVYLTDREVVVVNTSIDATSSIGRVVIEVVESEPKPLPTNYTRISNIYNITIGLEKGYVNITLPFDSEGVSSSDELKVAHYHNGKWEIVEPLEIDYANGLVKVKLSKLSSLVVVKVVEEVTTTTSTPTTPTETTETTPPTTTTETTTTTTPTETTPTTTSTITPTETTETTPTATETTPTTTITSTPTTISETSTPSTSSTTPVETTPTTTTPTTTTTYTTETGKPEDNTMLLLGIGIAIVVVAAAVFIVFKRR